MKLRLVGCLLFVGIVIAINNGLGKTPAMGYNTWNDFRCNITAAKVKSAADAIIRQGLNKLGYIYVNVDDCWAVGRDANGVIQADPVGFPNGIKEVADYVHSLGLKFGIYTDRGKKTCQGRPGSLGYEKIDAITYASWGVDYVKEDSCDATQIPSEAIAQYRLMSNALNQTGRPMYFSLCGWFPWYAPEGASIGNSWRVSLDCNTWFDILLAMDINARLAKYAGPGGWNDPDMLIGSSVHSAIHLTQARSRSMFSIWCVMAAPLLIGSNIIDVDPFDLETISNKEAIAIDQDPLGYQGTRLVGGDLSSLQIWGRKLSGKSFAIVFLNDQYQTLNMTCDSDCFSQLGLTSSSVLTIRNIWTKTTQNNVLVGNGIEAVNVLPHGGCVFLKLTLA